MSLPKFFKKLKDIVNIREELILPVSKGAVFIKDLQKRRKCPLCQQNLYLYYINFEEMFLMCENSNCDFPFGYEALQIVSNETELEQNPVKASKEFFEYPTSGNELPHPPGSIPTGTLSSLSCLSECDRLSQVSDGEDLSLDKQETFIAKLFRRDLKRRQQQQQNKEVQTNLNRIKELTDEMNKLVQETDDSVIKNQKWLKNLKVWEMETGRKLLTEEEKIELVKNEPKADQELVKISVGAPNQGLVSLSVNIKLLNNVPEESE